MVNAWRGNRVFLDVGLSATENVRDGYLTVRLDRNSYRDVENRPPYVLFEFKYTCLPRPNHQFPIEVQQQHRKNNQRACVDNYLFQAIADQHTLSIHCPTKEERHTFGLPLHRTHYLHFVTKTTRKPTPTTCAKPIKNTPAYPHTHKHNAGCSLCCAVGCLVVPNHNSHFASIAQGVGGPQYRGICAS